MPPRPIRAWPSRRLPPSPARHLAAFALGGLTAAALLGVAALPAAADAGASRYVQTNLVSDIPGMAQITDPDLVNAWGMSFGPSTPLWVSDNGADVTTLYRGTSASFAKVALTVSIPDGAPTGQVFNPTTDFVVSSGAASGAARFIFASENGSIDAWNPNVPAPGSTMAQSAVTVPDAVYKGLAISTGAGGDFLYAANFHAGTIDVFDGSFVLQHWQGAFRDAHIPAGYAPFNIANFDGSLYVTYARQDAAAHDDVAGMGHGFVDVFDLHGNLMRRLISHGQLNSPWGMAMAPAGFGTFSGDLLVGNFGNGRINAYDPRDGEFIAALRAPGDPHPLVIDGLWGLTFGNGTAGTPQSLLFSAGPDGESHGLFGTLTLAP